VHSHAETGFGEAQRCCAPCDSGADDCDVDGALVPRRRARHRFVFEPV